MTVTMIQNGQFEIRLSALHVSRFRKGYETELSDLDRKPSYERLSLTSLPPEYRKVSLIVEKRSENAWTQTPYGYFRIEQIW